jgi:CHAT domain-containing protein
MYENPLLQAGLVLAGANHRSDAGPTEEDGILAAEEIASLDLSSVDWAVLSGCDTGLGEVVPSEGVFGLRRAFQVAGAKTLIMSLWAVRDDTARVWMRAAYDARLRRGCSTDEAVRHATLTTLQWCRSHKRSDHPSLWAGFMAVGAWE